MQSIFLRRIGPDPHVSGAKKSDCGGCPDIWELHIGGFAMVVTGITAAVEAEIKPVATPAFP
jgi:hypothetical protein